MFEPGASRERTNLGSAEADQKESRSHEGTTYSSMLERTARGGGGFILANAVGRIFAFLFVLVCGRLLGADRFGVLALGMSVVGLVQSVGAFGFPTTIQRFLSGGGVEDSNELFASVVVVSLSITLAACVSTYVLAPKISVAVFSEPRLESVLRILLISVLLGVPMLILRAVLQAKERVSGVVGLDAVRHGVKLLFVVPLIVIVGTIESAAWSIVLGMGTALLLAVKFAIRLDVAPSFGEWRSGTGRVVRVGFPLLLVGLSYYFAEQADRLLLGGLSDSSAVGIYVVASAMALVMGTLHSSVVSIFMPVASEALREGRDRELKRLYLSINKWVGAVNAGVVVLLSAFGWYVLTLFGAEFATAQAFQVLLLLAAFHFLATWVGPTGALLQMGGHENLELINTLLFLIANVTLNVLLIPELGVVGAAIATLVAGGLRNVLQLLEIERLYAFVPLPGVSWGILGLAVVASVAHVGMPDGLLLRFATTLAFLALIAAVVARSLTPAERRLFGQILHTMGFEGQGGA